MSRIGLVSGFWGQNIGNAFFNLGGRAILSSAGHDVSFVQDQPAYWTFRNEAKGNYPNAFEYIEHLDIDLLVLQGPLLTRNFGNIWAETLDGLAKRRVPWAILSGGFREYSSQELAVATEIFDRYPPAFFSTRDTETFKRIEGLVGRIRSGIDSAFFMPLEYRPPKLALEPYVALAFDHYLEPTIELDLSRTHEPPTRGDPSQWSMAHPRRLNKLAARSKAHAYVGQMLDRRHAPTCLDGYTIVRPTHRTNPHLPTRIYKRANAIASDEPWTYASVYAGASATFSDRVHACVLSLAYGTPAQLYNPTTRRSALFARAGVPEIASSLSCLPLGLLDEERNLAEQFLRELE